MMTGDYQELRKLVKEKFRLCGMKSLSELEFATGVAFEPLKQFLHAGGGLTVPEFALLCKWTGASADDILGLQEQTR